MTTPATPAVPILEPSVAVDHLLDARGALLAVQRSSLAGQPLHDAMEGSIKGVDSALRIVRAIGKATKA